MANPLVSVCIPCFNSAQYIAETLESVLRQTWNPIEIIVVNDGSSDGSDKVLTDFQRRGIRIENQPNLGQCAAANKALELSSGEYVKFLDADDLLSATFIELQVSRLQGRDDAVASAEWGRFYKDDLSTYRLNPQVVWKDMHATDWLVESWMGGQPMMQCGLWLIPRLVLDRCGGWDESLSLINDFEFFSRVLCQVNDVLFAKGAELYYRSGISGSLSSQMSQAAAESAFYSIVRGSDHLLARRRDPGTELACANMMQSFIYTFYPRYPDLCDLMRRNAEALGGSRLPFPAGPRLRLLSRVVGWKNAKRIATFMQTSM